MPDILQSRVVFFFFHTLAGSQTFLQAKGRGEKLWELNSLLSISKMNMIFFHPKWGKKATDCPQLKTIRRRDTAGK